MKSSTSVTYLDRPLRISLFISLLLAFRLLSITLFHQFPMTARVSLPTRSSYTQRTIQPLHLCRHVNHLSTCFSYVY